MKRSRLNLISMIVFSLIAVLVAADLFTDQEEGASFLHLFMESIALFAALIGAVVTFRMLRSASDALMVAQTEASRWRNENRELLQGLSAAIGRQFSQWELSPAEHEIGYLLLKGLSMDEIASVRWTSERTARDQARSVYRKAGVSGRAGLSAFFLEDLLVPVAQAAE